MPEVIVEASQATSVRQATPDTPYPDPEVLVVDGTGAAVIHALIDLDLIPPVGEDAEVVGAFLQLYRAEAHPAGDKSVTVAPLDDDFDQETATYNNAPATRTPSSTDPAVPGGGQAGDLDELDITAAYSESVGADNAEASRWYGVKVTTTYVGALRWYSMFADPDLVPKIRLVYSVPAEAPSELFPADGTHVGEAKPYIGAHYNGNDQTEEMAAFQVEVASDDTFDGTVVFDSTERAGAAPELDLAGEVGFTAMTSAQTLYHRWRTKNVHGAWSPWSEPAEFTYTPKLTVTVTDPDVAPAADPTFTRATVAYKRDGTQVASGAPRFEAGQVGAAVMVEEGTTNLALRSAEFDNAAWTTASTATVTPNAEVAPDGTATADKLVEDTDSSQHYIRKGSTYVEGQPGSVSVFAKAGERSWMYQQLSLPSGFKKAWFDLANGVVGQVEAGLTATIQDVGDGWYRCTTSTAAVGTTLFAFPAFISTGNGQQSHLGDGASGIYIWGAQAELKAYPTSYMQTVAATATRNAETDHEIPGSVLDPTAGTIERWYQPTSPFGSTLRYLFDGGGAANENLEIWVGTDGKPHLRYGSGAAEITLDGANTLSSTEWSHIAAKWSSSGVSLLVNGVVVDSDATAPGLTFGALVAIGHKADNTLQQNGLTDDLRISNIARSDAEIIALYNSGAPAEEDEHTTYLLRADDTLVNDAGNYTDEVTPTFAWTVDSGTQEAVEIEVLRRNEQGVLVPHWELPRTVTTDTEFTLPDDYALEPGVDYRRYIRVWDDVERAELPGDPSYVEDVEDFGLRGLVVA